jgi:hypothetical protein
MDEMLREGLKILGEELKILQNGPGFEAIFHDLPTGPPPQLTDDKATNRHLHQESISRAMIKREQQPRQLEKFFHGCMTIFQLSRARSSKKRQLSLTTHLLLKVIKMEATKNPVTEVMQWILWIWKNQSRVQTVMFIM